MKTTEQDIQINRELVIALAGITEQEYFSFQLETAYLYLDIVLTSDEEERKLFMQSASFWKWWIRQWNNREKTLLDNHMQALTSFSTESIEVDQPENDRTLDRIIAEYKLIPDDELPKDLSFEEQWRLKHAVCNLLHIQPNRWAMRVTCHNFKSKKSTNKTNVLNKTIANALSEATENL